jgi:hypothetical protein
MIVSLARRSEQSENEAVQHTDLRPCRAPVRLAPANHMDRFVAGDCAPSSPEGAKILACTHPAFDGPMILFQDVVQILYGSVLAIVG